MLFAKSRMPETDYDPEVSEPAVRKSICTGEMTVGFVDKATGKFRDVKLVRTQAEVEEFMDKLGVDKIKTVY